MKKIIKIFCILFVFTISFKFSFAESQEFMLYKNIVLTNNSIEKVYGEKKGAAIIEAIDKFFLKIRVDEDKEQLQELEDRIEPILETLTKKKILSSNERTLKAVAENIYYRSKVLSDYLIK